MSYSTLKKALQLFDESADSKNSILNRTTKKKKSKTQQAKSVFKVPIFMKSDANKSVQKIKEQIKNDKELNLVQINLERLHKLNKTSYVNNIASTIIKKRLESPETINTKKEDSTVFTDEDFEKFEREYFQN
ncbi:uncharacterized protein LOC112681316 [Sipha flava]|uniref:Uncharacterized protein LOC112681316 n=1 Tax=Sipha flava TaxID=143950 RepID=A0A8B8FAI3_9HEMI|nr:uncharacterized protein LOC112681316 [Sipha flava]